MRTGNQWLCFGIADYPNSCVSVKIYQVVFKFRSKIAIFQAVNGPLKPVFRIVKSKARTFGSEVRMVIGAVKYRRNTVCFRNNAKKSAHFVVGFAFNSGLKNRVFSAE